MASRGRAGQQFVVQVGEAVRHDFHDDYADAGREVAQAFGRERLSCLRAILVARAYEFDGPDQGHARGGGEDLDLDFIGEYGRQNETRRGRCPGSRERRSWGARSVGPLEGRNIDLDLAPDVDLHVGVILFFEDIAIELFDDGRRPLAMKALPTAAFADGRVEVVE